MLLLLLLSACDESNSVEFDGKDDDEDCCTLLSFVAVAVAVKVELVIEVEDIDIRDTESNALRRLALVNIFGR